MKTLFYIIFLLLIALYVNINNLFSQSLKFEHITVDDGLSQSTVFCILQDSEGFIWFGTQGGVNKYDGYSFEGYKHIPGETNSLSSNWVLCFDEDNSGNMWIGTTAGLNKLNKKTGNITRYKNDPTKPESSLNDDIVYAVLVDKKGFVWAKTYNALNRLDTLSGKFSYYEHYIDLFSDYTNTTNNAYPILEDEKGNIWVGSAYGLFMFDRKYEQFQKFRYNPNNPNSLSNNYVSALIIDKSNRLWIGTKNGLNKYDTENKTFIHYFHDSEDQNSLSDNDVSYILEDFTENLWIATRNGGLNHFNIKESKFTSYQQDENNPETISGNEILSLFEDKSKILWIGTGANALNRLDMKKKKFELYKKASGEHSINLTDNVIASIFKNTDNLLWIGTWYGGLNIYNRETGEVKHFSSGLSGKNHIMNNSVHAILKDRKGRIIIGTKGGISVYENEAAGFVSIQEYFSPEKLPKLSDNRVYTMCNDRYNNIWVGTFSGLHKFNFETGEIKSFYSNSKAGDPKANLTSNQIQIIMEDHEGYIWIGTDKGLNRYNPLTGQFTHYQTGENIANSLSNNHVYSIVESYDNILWVGTGCGLNKFNWRDTSFTYYTKKDGLPDDKIYEIIEDGNRAIWFSTDRGIVRFDRKTNEIRAYDRDDGLQGLEFNKGAYYKSFDGELFFGGISGFNSFYPDSMMDNTNIPPVVLTIFEKVNIETEGINKINLLGKEELVISYKDFMFTINFAALEFTNPKKNQYKYIMEGLNDDWIYIGTQHSRTFSNIPPGEYVFKVKGSNNDLKWNEKEASLRIIITPPWWKSRWAYLMYIILIGGIIYYFIEIRTRKLKKSNQILREKQFAALEIAKQKEELSIKNKNITDSINYAKRIQEAMMPSVYMFKKLFPESFILYKPRDIVSGDFYWISEKNNKFYIAAVDCTGHGVPGAFMSIIGYDLLRSIIEQGIENTSEILNRLNEGVSKIFSTNLEDKAVKDGMDISPVRRSDWKKI
ncbi:MAG: hypothetical protein HY738_12365 [Bacteroidia bacterium]|nr:hypothetical protein [Bacteroidia bacterium]